MTAFVGFLRGVAWEDEENVRREWRFTRPRVLRDRMNPKDNLNDEKLNERFRFRRPPIVFFCSLIEKKIKHQTVRCFGFFPKGTVTGDVVVIGAFRQLVGVSKFTAWRCIWRVGSAFADLAGHFIRLPNGQETAHTKQNFTASQVHRILLEFSVIYLMSY